MILEHQGKSPRIDPAATIAPTAVLSGDVTVGAHCRILHGAVLTSEGGPVALGEHCIVMENAVIRGTARHPASLGNFILVGPHAHLTGCQVRDGAFLATGATLFNGAVIGEGAEVRIHGVVHIRSVLAPEAVVPIGWVAVGDPAEILPPGEHERIWALQEPLHFPRTVFGLEREEGRSMMSQLTKRYAKALARHEEDRILE